MAIVKILSRHSPSYASLVGYILRYIANEDKTGQAQVYTSNLRSDDMAGYIKEFIANEAFRKHPRSDKIHLFHEIVSFHADENSSLFTNEMVDDLAREYMRLRGQTGVMLGTAHRDREHIHLHFCVSALHFRTGRSFGLHRAQLQELKVSFQEYHGRHYPEIEKSFPSHGQGKPYLRHAKWHAKQKEQIVEKVRECFAVAKTQSHFLELLRDVDLHHYERNGTPTGVEYEGQKFRFSRLLDDGQFDALPIDRSEEQKALDEIRAVRENQRERDGQERNGNERERWE